MLAGYSKPERLALYAAPLALLWLTILLSRHPGHSAKLDVCYINRAYERPPPTWIPIRDGPLHNYSVYAMWASALVLALLPISRAAGLYALLYASAWFHATYVLLAALKAPLGDTNCAGRHARYPNGISGHYCYFVYVTLTLRLLASERLRRNPRAALVPLAVAGALAAAYAVGAVATLYRTFAHGYHSFRQIFLGSALGITSHAALEAIFAGASQPTSNHAAWLLSQSLVAFSLYRLLWPTEDAGHAIPPIQIAFHAALYFGIIASAYAMRPRKHNKTN